MKDIYRTTDEQYQRVIPICKQMVLDGIYLPMVSDILRAARAYEGMADLIELYGSETDPYEKYMIMQDIYKEVKDILNSPNQPTKIDIDFAKL